MEHKRLLLIGAAILLVGLVAYSWYKKTHSRQDTNNSPEATTAPSQPAQPSADAVANQQKQLAAMGDAAWKHWKQKSGGTRQTAQAYNIAVRSFFAKPQHSADEYARFAELFRQGVSESYDGEQRKIAGIAPNPELAIKCYNLALRAGCAPGKPLLDLAGIYHWGLGKQPANRGFAKLLYALALKVADDYHAGLARDRLAQMDEEQGNSPTIRGNNIEAFGSAIGGAGNPFVESFGQAISASTEPSKTGRDTHVEGIDEKHLAELQKALGIPDRNPYERPNHAAGRSLAGNPGENSVDNVHDHAVNRSMKLTLEKLRANTQVLCTIDTMLDQLKSMTMAYLDETDKRTDVLRVLDHLAKAKAKQTPADAAQIDALHLVWNRIHSNVNREKRDALRENLLNELSECVEHGNIVCPRGVFSHIIDTLNFVDPDVRVKPHWALNQEMMAKAAQIRRAKIERAPSVVKDALSSPSPSPREKRIVGKFTEKLKTDLRQAFQKDYVEPGLMTPERLESELSAWIDCL